jgi:hypothetical protein
MRASVYSWLMPRAPSPDPRSRAPRRASESVPVCVLVLVLVAILAQTAACRITTPIPDALISPYPDASGTIDTGATDAAPACDLLKQDCAIGAACYPIEGVPGATHCEKVMPGSAGPSSPCLVHTDCDAREVCAPIAEAQTTLCATLCDPAAVVTGCQRGAPCRLLAGYRVGFCVP